MSPIQKPPETACYVLPLCTSSAWRQVPGMAPRFKRSSPGRRWGACRDGVGMGVQQGAWLPWEHPPAAPALHIHFCFSHTHEPQRFRTKCCCTGAPSSADISYSDSLTWKNKYADMEAAKSGSWICQGQPAFQNAKGSCITYGKWDRSERSGMFLYCAGIVEMQKGILCAVFATENLLFGWIGTLITF